RLRWHLGHRTLRRSHWGRPDPRGGAQPDVWWARFSYLVSHAWWVPRSPGGHHTRHWGQPLGRERRRRAGSTGADTRSGLGSRGHPRTAPGPERPPPLTRDERRDRGHATTTRPPAAPAPPSVLRVVDGLVGGLSQLPEQDCRQSRLPRLRRAG